MKLPFSKIPMQPNLRSLHRGVSKPVLSVLDWVLLPALICFLATFILAAPIKIGIFSPPEPVLALVLAFCWALIRPSYIAPLVLALLGVFLDNFWGAPIGFYTFLLMLVYGTFVSIRAYVAGQDTLVILGVYGLTCLVFFILGTIIITISSGTVPRLIGVFEQMFATMACFPLVLYMLETYLHSDVRFQ